MFDYRTHRSVVKAYKVQSNMISRVMAYIHRHTYWHKEIANNTVIYPEGSKEKYLFMMFL